MEGEPGFDVVGESGDGLEAVRLVQRLGPDVVRLGPDVVLMDLRLREPGAAGDGIDGIEATRRILDVDARVRVVVLTSYGSQADVLRAVEAGARGCVLKAGPPEELSRAVRAAAAGGLALAPEAAASVPGRAAEPPLSERRSTSSGSSRRGTATGRSPVRSSWPRRR